MTTIADAFMNDFEEEEEEEKNLANSLKFVDDIQVKVDTINMNEDSEAFEENAITDLLESPELQDLTLKAEDLLHKDPSQSFSGLVEESDEYDFILQSNEMIRRIEAEILEVHKYACNIYASRFPELEQTVIHPVQYAKVVKKIKNDIDSVSIALEGVVSDHQKLSTAISASATTGRPLPNSEMKRMLEACDVIIKLDESRKTLLEYIKSRMLFIAPNLCALVSPDIATQLMAIAGGLVMLSKVPSCNIQTLGYSDSSENTKQTFFNKKSHQGIISACPLMLECPEDYTKKVLRILAAKISLAVRLDCHQTQKNDQFGQRYLKGIKEKIEKWQEPPEAQPVKPLPLPEEKRLSKRAGKRYRKMRERYKVTELQRMKNRVGFNVGEDRDDEGEGFGMIGKSGVGGALKITAKNTSKVRKLDQLNKMMVERERKKRMRRLTKGESSGLATSVVMNETQGMSFINPEAAKEAQREPTSGVSTYFGLKSFSKINL